MEIILLLLLIFVVILCSGTLHCKCPECGGNLKEEIIDTKLDKIVFKCQVCGKEFI